MRTTSTFDSEYQTYGDELPATKYVTPTSVEIVTGRLRVVKEGDSPGLGMGTRVYLDDVEIKGVASVSINIRPEDVIVAKLEVHA